MHRLLAPCLFWTLSACGTGASSIDIASESEALTAARCEAQTSQTAIATCFEAFRVCHDLSPNSEACPLTLVQCLPRAMPRHDQPRPPPLPPQPPRPIAPDEGDDGPCVGPVAAPPVASRPPPARPVVPHEAELNACHALARPCFAAGATAEACRAQVQACVQAAMGRVFTGRCAELQQACAGLPGKARPDCSVLTQHCNDGVAKPPPPAVCAPGAP